MEGPNKMIRNYWQAGWDYFYTKPPFEVLTKNQFFIILNQYLSYYKYPEKLDSIATSLEI